jgi:hypothetical protein
MQRVRPGIVGRSARRRSWLRDLRHACHGDDDRVVPYVYSARPTAASPTACPLRKRRPSTLTCSRSCRSSVGPRSWWWVARPDEDVVPVGLGEGAVLLGVIRARPVWPTTIGTCSDDGTPRETCFVGGGEKSGCARSRSGTSSWSAAAESRSLRAPRSESRAAAERERSWSTGFGNTSGSGNESSADLKADRLRDEEC